MKLFLQKNAKFSSAGGSAPRSPCLRRLGSLPPNPHWPTAAGGFAPRTPLASGGWGIRPQTPKIAPTLRIPGYAPVSWKQDHNQLVLLKLIIPYWKKVREPQNCVGRTGQINLVCLTLVFVVMFAKYSQVGCFTVLAGKTCPLFRQRKYGRLILNSISTWKPLCQNVFHISVTALFHA